MFDIRVKRTVNKPIQEVFAALEDHASYQSFPGIDSSELLEEGQSEKNGLGALRRVVLKPFTLEERIVAFERPTLLRYQIEKSSPITFEHIIGEVSLVENGDKTDVTWISKGHLRFPLLGTLLLDPMVQKQGGAGFASILKTIERR